MITLSPDRASDPFEPCASTVLDIWKHIAGMVPHWVFLYASNSLQSVFYPSCSQHLTHFIPYVAGEVDLAMQNGALVSFQLNILGGVALEHLHVPTFYSIWGEFCFSCPDSIKNTPLKLLLKSTP